MKPRFAGRAPGAAAGVVAALLLLTPIAGAVRGEMLLVSRASGSSGAAADASSSSASISADGRYIAFESEADNLSADDQNAYANIFLRDTHDGTTILVSRATGESGAGGDNYSVHPSISADGRYVVFESAADNLSEEDNDAYQNIFVRDTHAGITTYVNRAGPITTQADGNSANPSISADGRYVAFASIANNLSGDDNDNNWDVFLRELQGGTTLVSRASDGTASDSFSGSPSVSANGRYVAFDSLADNLSTEDQDAYRNVFVRDTQAGTTTLVSRGTGPSGPGGDGLSGDPSISDDGRYVAFESAADNLSVEDNDAYTNIFVRDLQQPATTTLVSRATGPAGVGSDGNTEYPSISADGRYVAFDSNADNLSPDDNNAYWNAFVRDLQTGVTILATRAGASGPGADEASEWAVLSADGRFVAFSSDADNLSAEDNNAYWNIFRRDVLGTPPRCSDSSASARHDAAVSLVLTCADDDGDAVTRSIVAPPAHGALGGIDQATGAVTYTPARGYSGSDSFTFRAADATGSSNTATASLTVATAPTPTLRSGRCTNLRRGTRRADRLNGTRAGDRILGLGGNDRINGLGGDDCLLGGAGNDRLTGGAGRNSYSGGPGKDTILAVNRRRDVIDCGPGKDTVRADRRDRVRRCERVRRTRR